MLISLELLTLAAGLEFNTGREKSQYKVQSRKLSLTACLSVLKSPGTQVCKSWMRVPRGSHVWEAESFYLPTLYPDNWPGPKEGFPKQGRTPSLDLARQTSPGALESRNIWLSGEETGLCLDALRRRFALPTNSWVINILVIFFPHQS